MARQLMFITGFTAQKLVDIVRSFSGSLGGLSKHANYYNSTAAVAETVMGHDAWEKYKNTNYKSMTGPRKPKGSVATLKRVRMRTKKMGGSMAKWTLQHEPEPFAGQDTRWTMDDKFTWLSPDGDVTATHIETLGEMIAEAFHNHKLAEYNKKWRDAKKTAKMTSTASEVSQWDGTTSVK